MNISLRIYCGPLTEPLPAEAVVSVGDVPEAFRSQPPLLVNEKKSWIISHAQLHTTYILSSKGYRTKEGRDGHILICLLLSARKRFAQGVSPMVVLDALEECFSHSLSNGSLPDKALNPTAYSDLIRKYPLEERSLLLPVMRGENTVAYRAENIKEISAILRHSRYPQLSMVGRLEIGLQCESTIFLSTKGTARNPFTVEENERTTSPEVKKKEAVETEKPDIARQKDEVHHRPEVKKETVAIKPERHDTPQPEEVHHKPEVKKGKPVIKTEMPDIPRQKDEVHRRKEIKDFPPQVPALDIVPPEIPSEDMPEIPVTEKGIVLPEIPIKEKAEEQKVSATLSSHLSDKTDKTSPHHPDKEIPVVEEEKPQIPPQNDPEIEAEENTHEQKHTSGHKKRNILVVAALLCLIGGVLIYIGTKDDSDREYPDTEFYDIAEIDPSDRFMEEVPVKEKKDLAYREADKESEVKDKYITEKKEPASSSPSSVKESDEIQKKEKAPAQPAQEDKAQGISRQAWDYFCRAITGATSQSLGGGVYILSVSHTSNTATFTVLYPEYEMYNIDSSQRATIKKNEEYIYAHHVSGRLQHGDGITVYIRNLDKGQNEISKRSYRF